MRAIRVVSLWLLMFVNAVQMSPTLLNTNLAPEAGTGWTTFRQINMPSVGEFQFWDNFGDLGFQPGAAYYRLQPP
jgi:hypothetical protein